MNRFGKLRLGKPIIGKPENSLKILMETRKSYDDALPILAEEALKASATRVTIGEFAKKASVTHLTIGEFAKKALHLPIGEFVKEFDEEFARHVKPYRDISSISNWPCLNSRMESLRTPWVLPDIFDKPMVGFARLSRLSDAAHTAEPYSPPVAELVSDELGRAIEVLSGESASERDSAAVRAGLKPELIAFPPDTYGKVVLAAGFKFRFTKIQAPQAVESGDRDAEFHSIYWRIFTELEQSIRHIVEKTLIELDGTNWIRRRVPEPIRKRWEERQEEDRSFERPVYALIQYADFMELADIVGKSDNWDEAFKPIFRNRDDFITSLRRLHPVRKAIAHSRPLARADALTLVTEATRIFNFLGIRVLR